MEDTTVSIFRNKIFRQKNFKSTYFLHTQICRALWGDKWNYDGRFKILKSTSKKLYLIKNDFVHSDEVIVPNIISLCKLNDETLVSTLRFVYVAKCREYFIIF